MDIDNQFGSLRDDVVGAFRDFLGGVQGTFRTGGGAGTSLEVGFGENRVMSGLTLALALLGGVLLGALVLGRGK